MTAGAAAPTAGSPSGGTPGVPLPVLVALITGPVVSMVDSSAVAVAVPAIAADLGAGIGEVSWAVTAYLLGIAAFLPATVWLGRRFGTRRAYTGALVAFATSSALCATARDVEVLTALRAVQGVTSAPLIPLALTLLFDGQERRRPPALAGLLFFLAPALGPTVGAVLVHLGDWRLVFLINPPLIAVGLLGALRMPPDPPGDGLPVRLDLRGLGLLAAGAVALTTAAAAVADAGWASPLTWGTGLAGGLLLAAYAEHVRWLAPSCRHASTPRAPAVSLSLLADGAGRAALGICALASVVLFAVVFLVPVLLVQQHGTSVLVAGLVLLPQGIAMGVCSGAGEALVRRAGPRTTVATGMVVLTATTALLLTVDSGTSPWTLALLLTGRGVALGLTLQPLITGIMSRAGGDVADVSTLFNLLQRLGASLGIAAVASFYEARAGQGGDAFHDTVLLLSAVSLLGVSLTALLPSGQQPTTAPTSSGGTR